MFDPPSLPSPGWFPDPHRPGASRWWNGRNWEELWDDGHIADDLPEIGEWLNLAFTSAIRRWRALCSIALVSSVPATVLINVSLSRLAEGVVIEGEAVSGWTNDRLGVVVPLLTVALLLTAIGSVAYIVLMLRTFDGQDAATATVDELRSGWSAIGGAMRVLPRTVGWTLLLVAVVAAIGLLVAGLMIVALPLGIIVLLVLIPVAVAAAIRLAFIGVSLVDRRGQPFGRSIEVSRGRFWAVLGRMLLFGIIVWLCSVVIQTVAGVASGNGFGGAFGSQVELDEDGMVTRFELADVAPTASPWELVVVGLAALVTAVVVSGVGGAATAHLYRTRNAPEDRV